jgi:hypothetical protein
MACLTETGTSQFTNATGKQQKARENTVNATYRYVAILSSQLKIAILFAGSLFLMTSCGTGYGPLEDHSEFVSARLVDNRTVLFSFHRFTYRPATGWRAFPDGGIPDYVMDTNLVGVYDLRTLEHKIFLREINTSWQQGSGLFFIHSVKGSKALVTRGGQLRGPFKLATKYLMLDIETGKPVPLDLKSELNQRGRDPGYIYLVDADGTLVFVTLSINEAQDSRAYRNTALVPEIWVRTPGGNYVKAAASAHYQNTVNGDVIYWEPSTRDFMAFSIADQKTRKAPEYKIPGHRNAEEGVTLSSERRAMEIGVNVNGQSKYNGLDLKPDVLE